MEMGNVGCLQTSIIRLELTWTHCQWRNFSSEPSRSFTANPPLPFELTTLPHVRKICSYTNCIRAYLDHIYIRYITSIIIPTIEIHGNMFPILSGKVKVPLIARRATMKWWSNRSWTTRTFCNVDLSSGPQIRGYQPMPCVLHRSNKCRHSHSA